MAVLLEDLSVIVRRMAIDERFRGGWEEFVKQAPKLSLCYDRTLARVGFLHPELARAFVAQLESRGLVHLWDGKAVDIAVVNAVTGPSFAGWLNWEEQVSQYGIVTVGYTGCKPGRLCTPSYWPPLMSEDAVYSGGGDVSAAAAVERIYTLVLRAETTAEAMDLIMVEEVAEEIREGVAREILPAAEAWADGEAHHLARSHFVEGFISQILGLDGHAERAYREALVIDPEDIKTLLELVKCLDRQGKTSDALIYAADAAIVAPDDASVWDLLAICYLRSDAVGRATFARLQGLPSDASKNLTRAIRDIFEKFTKGDEVV